MPDRHVLITGGTGFLGQHLTHHLLRADPALAITVLDRRPSAAVLHDFSNEPRVRTLLDRDILDPEALADAFGGADTVIHLAGIVSFSIKDETRLMEVNVRGSTHVFETALAQGVRRVIHVSSVAALGYADDADHAVDETFSFEWEKARHRHKYYMLSKHLGDRAAMEARTRGLPVLILYPGLMYGPGDLANSSRLIRALGKGRIPFNMPGGTNIVDVRDVARGVTLALEKDVAQDDLLLSGHNLTFTESNEIIAEALGVSPPKRTLPRWLREPMFRATLAYEKLSRRKLELTADNLDSAFLFRYFSNEKAARTLGWRPEIPFETTVADTIEWMRHDGLFDG